MNNNSKFFAIGVFALACASFARGQDTYVDPLYSYIPASFPETVSFNDEFLFGIPNGPTSSNVSGNWFKGFNVNGTVLRCNTGDVWGDYTLSNSQPEPAVGVWQPPSTTGTCFQWYMCKFDPFPATPLSSAFDFEIHFRYNNSTALGDGLSITYNTTTTAPTYDTTWNPQGGDNILSFWNDNVSGFRIYLCGTEYDSFPVGWNSDTDLLLRMQVSWDSTTSEYKYYVAITDNTTVYTFTKESTAYPNLLWVGNPFAVGDGTTEWTSLQVHNIRIWQ